MAHFRFRLSIALPAAILIVTVLYVTIANHELTSFIETTFDDSSAPVTTFVESIMSKFPTIKISNNSRCLEEVQQWKIDLELFLPIPPSDHGLQECERFILPSLALFWPQENLRLLFVTDGEKKNAAEVFANRLLKVAVPRSGINETLGAKSRVSYSVATFPIDRGWDRQQWLMFWADNFTSAEYVGFLDSDAVFVTRTTKSDLFINGLPVVRSLYGKPHDPSWWVQVPRVTKELIGRPEPFTCMSYFPVIIKNAHLKLMREHMRQMLKKDTFDEAFAYIASKRIYSQFNLMCAYLWYFQRDSYFWIVGQRDPNWAGPVPIGQVASFEEAGIDRSLLARLRPHLTIHWNYETFRNEPHALTKVLRTGICYSMTDDDYMRPGYCRQLAVNRTEKVNNYEWIFESHDLLVSTNRSLDMHRERLKLIDQCRHIWNIQLITDLTFHD